MCGRKKATGRANGVTEDFLFSRVERFQPLGVPSTGEASVVMPGSPVPSPGNSRLHLHRFPPGSILVFSTDAT